MADGFLYNGWKNINVKNVAKIYNLTKIFNGII